MDDCDWLLSVEKACDWLRIEPGVTVNFLLGHPVPMCLIIGLLREIFLQTSTKSKFKV